MSQKIVTNLFRYAAGAGAESLTVNAKPGCVTLDCHLPEGRIWTLAIPTKLEEEFLAVLRRLLQLAPGELTAGKHGKLRHRDCRLDFRLTVRPEDKGEKIVINIVNQPFQLWRLNQLGLEAAGLKEIKKFLSSGPGLMAVSSPSRQGKSSTLAALLLEINDPAVNLYWLSRRHSAPACEIPGVNYLESLPANWEKVLMHDSDLIFSDDADEEWVIAQALRAAATGRRVIIALEAASAGQASNRILDIAAKHGLSGASLKLLLNQHLADWPVKSEKKGRRTRIGRFKIWRS